MFFFLFFGEFLQFLKKHEEYDFDTYKGYIGEKIGFNSLDFGKRSFIITKSLQKSLQLVPVDVTNI